MIYKVYLNDVSESDIEFFGYKRDAKGVYARYEFPRTKDEQLEDYIYTR